MTKSVTGPYSNFRVGASLLLANGSYHDGANVEIASTPVGICAERCALAPVIASYARGPEVSVPNLLPLSTRRTLFALLSFTFPEADSTLTDARQYSGTPADKNLPTIRALAVATDINPPASPCGMCRQFIREFCDLEMKVFMYGGDAKVEDGEALAGTGKGGKAVAMTMGELLPMSL